MDGDQLATPEATPVMDPAPVSDPAAPLNPALASASSTESGQGTANGPDGGSAIDLVRSYREENLLTARGMLNNPDDEVVISALTRIRDCFSLANPRFSEFLPSAELVDFGPLLCLLRSNRALVKEPVIETLRFFADARPTEAAHTLVKALPELDEENLLLAIEAIKACGDHALDYVPAVAGFLKNSSRNVRLASARFLMAFYKESVIVAKSEMCDAIKTCGDQELQQVLMEAIIVGSLGSLPGSETAKLLLGFPCRELASSILRGLGEEGQAVRIEMSKKESAAEPNAQRISKVRWALALLADPTQSKSVEEIAAEVGCSHQNLRKNKEFANAWKVSKESRKRGTRILRGSKSKDGTLEAVAKSSDDDESPDGD